MKNYTVGIILIVVGAMFLLDTLGIMEFHFVIRKFWPVVLIVIGIGILMRRK
jgi:uncharacterized membrane protein (UPF0136 family)